jgi:hypothetical protein
VKIDPRKEKCYSACELTRLLKTEFGIERSHFTIRRWMTKGTRGKTLEYIPIGGQLCSSIEALERFLRLTGLEGE